MDRLRGSGFGLLGAVQALGDFLSTAVVGLLYVVVSAAAGFAYPAAWMILSAGTTARNQAHRAPESPQAHSAPMTGAEGLVDAFDRVRDLVHAATGDLDVEHLAFRIDPESNSIGWLIWHLTRIQDDHVAAARGVEQVWVADGWAERFALPFDRRATGYGHTSEEVAALRVTSGTMLLAYHDAVHSATVAYLRQLAPADLDRVVDEGWDPPVTLGARLVSVISDDIQHAGQAAFIRGILERSERSRG